VTGRLRIALLAAILVAAAACGTPAPVRTLATHTAGNVSIVNTRLRMFARDQERLAEERYAIVRELDDRVTEAEKELAFKLHTMKLANDTDKLRLFEDLDMILRTLAELRKQVSDRRAALQDRIHKTRSPLSPPVNPLTAAENALTDLGKADAFGETVHLYGKLVGEVVTTVKEAEAAHETAKTATLNGARSAAAARKKEMAIDPETLRSPR
jgi:hypothetical protein